MIISTLSAPPATPAVPASPPSYAASASSNGPDSFASYLKSVANRQSEEDQQSAAGQGSSAAPKLSMGVKDKAEKDAKKNAGDKENPLLANTTLVPLPVTAAAEPKPFTLAWPLGKGAAKGEQSAGTADKTSAQLDNQTQQMNASALKTSVGEARANAPVAFGVTLSKVDGLKTSDLKANETRPKAASEAASGKSAAAEGISKAAESKSSSGNQQRHTDSSRDGDQPSQGGTPVKASGASAGTQADSLGAAHAAAPPSSSQTPIAAASVQNAYGTTPAAIEKTAPAAPTAPVAEPPQTPMSRPHNIDLKIPGADNTQVDVRVSQRAGDVQVTVRTPDGELAQSLRQHLPELSDRLSQTGAAGNVWQPQPAPTANGGGNDADSRYSDDAQTQQQNQQQQHSRGNSNNGGQQRENETSQPFWFTELSQAEKESK